MAISWHHAHPYFRNSVIKVLEGLHVLDRMMPILEEAGCSLTLTRQLIGRSRHALMPCLQLKRLAIVRYRYTCMCLYDHDLAKA